MNLIYMKSTLTLVLIFLTILSGCKKNNDSSGTQIPIVVESSRIKHISVYDTTGKLLGFQDFYYDSTWRLIKTSEKILDLGSDTNFFTYTLTYSASQILIKETTSFAPSQVINKRYFL